MKRKSPEVSVVIPTLNEEKAIKDVVRRCKKSLKDHSHEIIVVDGLSKDGTLEKAREEGARIVIEKRKGKGIALQTGVERALGSIIVTMDGDGTHPPEYIPEMIDLLKKCDVVVGSRLLHEGPFRDLLSFIQYKLFPFIMRGVYKKFKTSEPFSGMRVIRKPDWYRLGLKSKDFLIETEMEIKMVKMGFKVIEVPIPSIKRRGRSKILTSPMQWVKIYKFIKKNEKILEKDAKIYKVIKY